ncbi:major royal jelly protein domain-containing protein [Phthorimaea operculella]|nr:major royal jelly protein domain-containing protein [Phthorimaea operculella]
MLFAIVCGGHPHNIAWSGGPLHLECEHSAFLTHSPKCVRENVIVTKAVTFKEKIYVISPRWKRGVLATVWLVVHGRRGVELQAFPSERDHRLEDCKAVQNAVDFYLDPFGNLWILDTGVVETLDRPRCTCPPKVVVINIPRRKVTRLVTLTAVEPTSLLQNIVVEYEWGKSFIYISDAARGAIIVHDSSIETQWSVMACAPAMGLQVALVKRSPGHTVLVMVRLQHRGLLEMDTAALKRKNSLSPLRVFGEQSQPVVLLGSTSHHIYVRHSDCGDVLSWDTREAFDESNLQNIHSPGPRLTPTSVAADPFKHVVLVLDSNYGETVNSGSATYHRITFIDQW